MSDGSKTTRGLPPALTLAFAIWIAMTFVRLVFVLTVKEPWAAIRFSLISEGTSFAAEVLAMIGSFELARRLTGPAALGSKVAGWGFAGVIVFDVGYGLFNLMERPWEHATLMKVSDYGFFGFWLVALVGLAIAHWRDRRVLAILVVAVSLLTWPPPFIAKEMYSWLPGGKAGYVIEIALRLVRMLFMVAAFTLLAKGSVAAADRVAAASGLRTASRSQWLRLVAALAVPLLTLMVIAGRGKGGIEMLKLATITAHVVNIVALTQFAIGALRTARASVTELGRWTFALGSVATLWASGVMLGQLSWIYKMLYKNDSLYGRSDMAEYAQALSIALPITVTAGMAIVAVAISGFAARSGNDELRGHAQAKGAGFVTLTLVALAITGWMVPKAQSLSALAMLMLLAAGAGLVAIVMIARLLNLAAEALEKEPSLPTASVVHSGTRSP